MKKNEEDFYDEPIDMNEEKPLEKEEGFYDDFYDYVGHNREDDIEEEPDLESQRKKATRMKVAVTIILLIVLAVLILLLTRSCDHKKVIKDDPAEVIVKSEIVEINEGEEFQIDYELNNFRDEPTLTFTSLDEKVASVSESGLVKGISSGNTEIIISYFIDKVSYEKKCVVTVKKKEVEKPKEEEKPKDTSAPKLTVNISNAKDNTWTNHDVTIKVSAKDNSKVTLEYVLDCTNNCKFNKVSNGQIVISKSGTTIVNIRARDANGNKTSKKVTIKIDKDKPSCSLTVNADGTLTSIPKDNNMAYYGYNSSYSGSNESSKKITTAGTYTYYVKDAAGNTNTCSITVKTKVQYRSRTCAIEHMTFSSWYVYQTVNTTKCSLYSKSEAERAGNTWYHQRTAIDNSNCNNSTSQCYTCKSYGRSLQGCNWGNEEWGPYQDSPIEETKKIQVEKKTVFYS